MVKIRLSKTGKTHQISYRIVAQDTRTKRDGKFLEILGYHNPAAKPSLAIKKDRLDYWIGKGAKPTLAVTKLLNQNTNIQERISDKSESKDQDDSSKSKIES